MPRYDPISLWLARMRHRRKYATWLRDGKPYPTAHLAKQLVIHEFARRYGPKVFIETGTHMGTMVEAVKRDFDAVYSIELADALYANAVRRFRKDPHVHILHGDSGVVLPALIRGLTQPALFWLDGHYSGGVTACGGKETPISEELGAVLAHPVRGHVILIDDARCFTGESDYPELGALRRTVLEACPDHLFEVSDDIIRIHKPL